MPVWERGRLGRLCGGLVEYARTAWWGWVSARLVESRPLEIVQAVILRNDGPGAGPEGERRGRPARLVLLSIRSDLLGWELPGGTIESGETPEQALIREVREETGLEVGVEGDVGVWIRDGFRPHVARVYRCRVVGGRLAPSSETPRLAWFDAEALPEALFPWYQAPLASALAAGNPAEHRERQGGRTILRAMWIDLAMRWRGLPPQVDRFAGGSKREMDS